MIAITKRRSPATTSRARRRRPTVELLETRQLLSTFVVNNTNDGGPGSLRRAIVNSNADTAQTNLITFNLGSSGVQTISLASALPAITQPVTIEGTTDGSGNPLVELNGAGAGSSSDGLMVQANGTTIEGLIIVQFGGAGINVSSNNNVIADNFIGTEGTGGSGLGNGSNGVFVTGSNNQIIRSADGYGNIIAGNGLNGVMITGAGATGNTVAGDWLGSAQAPNLAYGIVMDSQASYNLIGTNGDGVNDVSERNIISGNDSWGVQIHGVGTEHNVVAGNYIGTGRHGAAAVPNASGGVLINAGATFNLIGTDGVSASNADEGNLISGNTGPGVAIGGTGTNSNVVAGNLIGTDATGTAALGNGDSGVSIGNGAQSNVIGTNGDGNGDAAERNLISGNANQGVYIGGSGANFNVVAGNYIGVDIMGTNPLGNGDNGVWIAAGAQSNRIGVNTVDLGAADEPNVISANTLSGVSISDAGTNFNTVSGNWIGIDPSVNHLPNGQDGVSISNGAQSNMIGGSTALANVIDLNTGNGVGVYDDTTTGNTIRCNWIRGNGGLGIALGTSGTPNPNHGNTPAIGPNNLLNYPVITSANSGTTTTVGISFVSLPGSSYTIDFYATPKNSGEGSRWLGSVSMTTDATGQIIPPTTFNLLSSSYPGQWITATATDQAGDTSEFSNAWQLPTVSNQVAVSPSITSPTYGQSLAFTTTVIAPPGSSGFPTPMGTIQFQVDGAPLGAAVTMVNGAATSAGTSKLPAGVHTISAVYSGDSTYTSFTQTISQTITPAVLTITANNASMVSGAVVPPLSVSYSGFVNGDAASSLSGQPKVSTSATSLSPAGSYPIVPAGASSPNYTIRYTNGILVVSPPPKILAAAALTQKRNKRSKPVLTGYQFTFDSTMSATAGSPASYQVQMYVKVKVKVKVGKRTKTTTQLQLRPVGFTVNYSPSSNVAQLLTGKQAFTLGGQITLVASGITSAAGGILDGNGDGIGGDNAVYNITPKGMSIRHA